MIHESNLMNQTQARMRKACRLVRDQHEPRTSEARTSERRPLEENCRRVRHSTDNGGRIANLADRGRRPGVPGIVEFAGSGHATGDRPATRCGDRGQGIRHANRAGLDSRFETVGRRARGDGVGRFDDRSRSAASAAGRRQGHCAQDRGSGKHPELPSHRGLRTKLDGGLRVPRFGAAGALSRARN